MKDTFPVYMYINSQQYLQQIFCTTQSNIEKQSEQLKWKYLRNSIIMKVNKDNEIKVIPKQQLVRIDGILEKLDAKGLLINGSHLKLKSPDLTGSALQWSSVLGLEWEQFVANGNVYAKVQSNKQKA